MLFLESVITKLKNVTRTYKKAFSYSVSLQTFISQISTTISFSITNNYECIFLSHAIPFHCTLIHQHLVVHEHTPNETKGAHKSTPAILNNASL